MRLPKVQHLLNFSQNLMRSKTDLITEEISSIDKNRGYKIKKYKCLKIRLKNYRLNKNMNGRSSIKKRTIVKIYLIYADKLMKN